MNDLLVIDPRQYDDGPGPSSGEVLESFRAADAFWAYEGEPSPEKPHAELTSGLCSDAYLDCSRFLSFPRMAEITGRALAMRLIDNGVERVDWVVASAYAAIPFGPEVAKVLGARAAYVEKDPDDPERRRMLWHRMEIPRGARVLQIEELITTLGTAKEVRRAVIEGNDADVNFLSVVGTLINRAPDLSVVERGIVKVVSLVDYEIRVFDPAECEFCAVDSPRVRPKAEWARLTGQA